jgi:hypothetical protein
MRVHTIASCAALAIGASAVLPASGAGLIGYPYQGLLTVETTSVACGGNPVVDDIYTALYAPVLSGFSTGPGVLHLSKLRQAVRMEDTKAFGLFKGSGNYNGTRLTGRGTLETFTGTYSDDVISPKTIEGGVTQFVTIVGSMTNFDGRIDCTVSFRASFAARAS